MTQKYKICHNFFHDEWININFCSIELLGIWYNMEEIGTQNFWSFLMDSLISTLPSILVLPGLEWYMSVSYYEIAHKNEKTIP